LPMVILDWSKVSFFGGDSTGFTIPIKNADGSLNVMFGGPNGKKIGDTLNWTSSVTFQVGAGGVATGHIAGPLTFAQVALIFPRAATKIQAGQPIEITIGGATVKAGIVNVNEAVFSMGPNGLQVATTGDNLKFGAGALGAKLAARINASHEVNLFFGNDGKVGGSISNLRVNDIKGLDDAFVKAVKAHTGLPLQHSVSMQFGEGDTQFVFQHRVFRDRSGTLYKGFFQTVFQNGVLTTQGRTEKGLTLIASKGVLKAVSIVNTIIAPKIIGLDPTYQTKIDKLLIDLDGSKNKSRLGANSILSVSQAVCELGAILTNRPTYRYLAEKYQLTSLAANTLPTPTFNLINGGKHGAGNNLDFQEFQTRL